MLQFLSRSRNVFDIDFLANLFCMGCSVYNSHTLPLVKDHRSQPIGTLSYDVF